MGGFWPSVAMTLANRAAGECDRTGEMVREAMLAVTGDSATVLQAWQAAQDSQCPVALGVMGSEAWPEACPAQSGGVAAEYTMDPAGSLAISWSKWPSALDSWA